MDYTTLSLAQVQVGLEAMAADVPASFGRLDVRQLNWRPDATKWSVAQCLEHLLAANRLMSQAARQALACPDIDALRAHEGCSHGRIPL